jgi:two-component system invasion response regulator UvrY
MKFSSNNLPARTMNILIADDHLVVRRGLILIIKDEYPDALFDEAVDGKEALEKLRANQYDISILDITMPEMTGLEVVRQLQTDSIKTPVLVLTSHPEEQYARRVLKAGAAGFIGKEMAAEELILAIRKILRGKKYISESVSEQMATDLRDPDARDPHDLLSVREFQVMKLLANGKTVSEIAEELAIGIPTVSTYRNRVLEKMNLANNAELMRYAISQKLA